MLFRAEFVVYVQALQRRAHAFRIKDCRGFDFAIRYLKRHECGFKSITLNHQLKLVDSIDAAFKAQCEEPTGLALRGPAGVLQEDDCKDQPQGDNGKADFVDVIVRRQRRIARSIVSAELDGLVDRVEQMMVSQVALHHIYCGTNQAPEDMEDLLETGRLYPPLGLSIDARAVCGAASAADIGEPQASSLTLHLL